MRPVFHEDWCALHLYHRATCSCPNVAEEHPPTDILRVPDADSMNVLLSALAGELIANERADGFRVVASANGYQLGSRSPSDGGIVLTVLARDGATRLVVLEHGMTTVVCV
jgi:hypothetical protein